MQLGHVTRFERHSSVQHRIKDNSSTPYVARIPFIAFVFEDLRCDVGRGATLLFQKLILLNQLADPEITDFDVALGSQEDVVKFDVPVKNIFLVDVLHACNYLLEEELGDIFL